MKILPLTPFQVPAALRLSTQAGWNQTPADWRRFLALWPDNCLAGHLQGQLVATATLAQYGPLLGWVGMVLVDTTHRGQGFGQKILSATLQLAHDKGLEAIGLDATDFGRPLYQKYGFTDAAPIHRWSGELLPMAIPNPLPSWDLPLIRAFDRQLLGWDRSALLAQLSQEPANQLRMFLQNGQVQAYGCCRPGRLAGQIGPLVARDANFASTILQNFAPSPGGTPRPLILDLPDIPQHVDFTHWLSLAGFRVSRRLMRMVQPAAPQWLRPPGVIVAAGFELG